MNRNWMLAALLGGALAAPVGAADAPPPTETTKETGQDKQVSRLVEEFGVTKEQVAELRAKGWGWGEVRHALAISRKSGKPLAEIVAQRDAGAGWGEIARKEGFSLGEAAGRGHDEKTRPSRPERPERAGGRGEGRGKGGTRGGPKK